MGGRPPEPVATDHAIRRAIVAAASTVLRGGHLAREPRGELDRGRPADLRDAERGQQPLERATARLLDRAVEILGALAREPVEALEVVDGEPEEVSPGLDQAPLQQLLKNMPARALHVHPAGKEPELLGDARRAGQVRAVVADGTVVANDRGPADRARDRHLVLALGASPTLEDRPDDLRNDIARLLEDDGVADQNVLPPDLVEVVERRPRDRRPRDLDRPEVGHGRQRPGPADVRHGGNL